MIIGRLYEPPISGLERKGFLIRTDGIAEEQTFRVNRHLLRQKAAIIATLPKDIHDRLLRADNLEVPRRGRVRI